MNMLFIDTNIFLEVQFQDARWKECGELLRKVENEEIEALTTDFIVYSIILKIESKTKSIDKIEKFVNALTGISGLRIFHPEYETIRDSLRFVRKYGLDFDDALVVASMIANKVKKLVSFDRGFDKVKEIVRIEPYQI